MPGHETTELFVALKGGVDGVQPCVRVEVHLGLRLLHWTLWPVGQTDAGAE